MPILFATSTGDLVGVDERKLFIYSIEAEKKIKELVSPVPDRTLPLFSAGGETDCGKDAFVFESNANIITYDANAHTLKYCPCPFGTSQAGRGILLPDGNVVLISSVFVNKTQVETTLLVFSPKDNQIKKSLIIPTPDRCSDGILLPSGDILLISRRSIQCLIYSPEKNKIIQTFEDVLPETRNVEYQIGSLLPNGDSKCSGSISPLPSRLQE